MVPKGIEGNYVILTKHFHFITTLPTCWYPAYRVVFLCFIGSKGGNNDPIRKLHSKREQENQNT